MIPEALAAGLLTVSAVAIPAPTRVDPEPGPDPLTVASSWPKRLSRFVQEREAAREARIAAREALNAPVAPTGTSRASRDLGGPTAAQWRALRACESGGDYSVVSDNGLWFGAYQFTLETWASYGPPGNPAEASPAEQDRRARALYASRGAQPWPICGRHLGG